MKQILQDLRSGVTALADVPRPAVKPGHLLVGSRRSLISAGTERMLVEFGRANLLAKARQQPARVRQALDKVKTDGLLPTLEAIRAKLDQPMALGYCNAGVVVEVGRGVSGFAPGDRVASNGYHAQFVQVPTNLAAQIPSAVSDEAASFTVLGAIALQGIRLLAPTLGERFAVIGLGLVGQLTVQLLRANGCAVLAIDLNSTRLAIAQGFGATTVDLKAGQDAVATAMELTAGAGIDGAIVTAATDSSEPITQAARMSRKRGRIVLVGNTGLELQRADFYEKELTFQVSCSYGPGRYDERYENGGQDYPFGFVRWTEQRNFEAILALLADGRLDPAPLISHRFPLQRAAEAYDLIAQGDAALGVIIEYPSEPADREASNSLELIEVAPTSRSAAPGKPIIGVIGAGNFAVTTLLPAFKHAGARLKAIASTSGRDCAQAGRKFGFARATTEIDEILGDAEINAVVIATRHDSHARLVEQALAAGKHVFVEKPLAISRDELTKLAAIIGGGPIVMVGFNRRFAPQVIKMRQLLGATAGARQIVINVNAGALPADHWTRNRANGGRIIGEGCHFVDLARYLAGCAIVGVRAEAIHPLAEESISALIRFEDGSLATINYLTNGHRSFLKERITVFCAGRVLELDNFRRLRGFGWPGFRKLNLWRQDKGHAAEVAAFIHAVEQGGPAPIAPSELIEVTEATLTISASIFGID